MGLSFIISVFGTFVAFMAYPIFNPNIHIPPLFPVENTDSPFVVAFSVVLEIYKFFFLHFTLPLFFKVFIALLLLWLTCFTILKMVELLTKRKLI
jgi:hypothetical protein